MEINDVVSLLFGSGILVSFCRWIYMKFKKIWQRYNALCKGVQALLRDSMITRYNEFTPQGYAPLFAKQNFDNMWHPYHTLDENGVMDEYHETFMELPDFPENKEGE